MHFLCDDSGKEVVPSVVVVNEKVIFESPSTTVASFRDSVEDRQSRIDLQTINEGSRRNDTAKAKLKAANQQERIKLWKQHFENLLGNPPKITHELITRIISQQLEFN